jgi:lysine-specific demethylase/histidyl-hydroxylase NO66
VARTLNPPGRAQADDIWGHFKDGCSVRVLNPQSYHPPLWKLLARLQDYFGCMAGANTYLTPGSTQGFAPHYDDIDAFLLQTEGAKCWRLYENPLGVRLPTDSSGNFEQRVLGPVLLEVNLCPGDLLYLPRGIVHQAVVPEAETHSLHVTVSTYQNNSWSEFMRTLLPAALDMVTADNVHFREGLPINYLSYMGSLHSDKTADPRRKAFATHVKKLFSSLVRRSRNSILRIRFPPPPPGILISKKIGGGSTVGRHGRLSGNQVLAGLSASIIDRQRTSVKVRVP